MSDSTSFLRQKNIAILSIVAIFTVLAVALLTYDSGEANPTPSIGAEPTIAQASQKSDQEAKARATLKRVEAVKVCMVNNALFPNDQIPVEVDGKTYYGCCDMCKARLQNDEQARTAVDPVSKKKVDKAKAVIGATPEGKILYFESEKTFKQYNAGAR